MLNEMRLGKLSSESIAKFRQLDRPLKDGDDLGATELYVLIGSLNPSMRLPSISI